MYEPDTPTGPELDAVRDWDAGAAPLDGAARERIRGRLLAEVGGTSTRAGTGAPWRRTGFRLALSGALAAALAATLLVGVDHGGGSARPGSDRARSSSDPGMATVSARTVLHGAAVYERRHEKPVAPRDDQFVYTKEITKEIDRATGATKVYTDENWRSVDGSKKSWVMEIGHGWWAPPLEKGESSWPPAQWSALEKLPTDPHKLLSAVAAYPLPAGSSTSTAGFGKDDWDFVEFKLAGLLSLDPVMPHGLRPAVYEALGMVPGVKAVPGQQDAKGRTGVAIVYKAKGGSGGFGRWMVFDPKTYAYLGDRDQRTSDDGRKKYTQLSYLADWAITDRVKQRP